jgi:hypothetical protein
MNEFEGGPHILKIIFVVQWLGGKFYDICLVHAFINGI